MNITIEAILNDFERRVYVSRGSASVIVPIDHLRKVLDYASDKINGRGREDRPEDRQADGGSEGQIQGRVEAYKRQEEAATKVVQEIIDARRRA